MTIDLLSNRVFTDPVRIPARSISKRRKQPSPFAIPAWLKRCKLYSADEPEGKQRISTLLKSSDQVVSIDTETTSKDSHVARLLTVSIGMGPDEAIFLRFRSPSTDGDWLPVPKWQNRAKVLQEIFKRHIIVMQNRKYDERVLDRELGPHLSSFQFRAQRDTMLGAYLEDGSQSTALKKLSEDKFGLETIEFESVDFSDQVQFLHYACQDAILTWRLDAHFSKEQAGTSVYKMMLHQVEEDVVDVLREMEDNGILVDRDVLAQQQKIMAEEVIDAKAQVFKLAGREFKLDSTAEVSRIIYGDLKIPPTHLTPGGKSSTRAGVLEGMSNLHPFIPAILEYRHLNKLKSQYLDTLPDYIRSDGRVHTSYMQTVTPTGRLTAKDPNMLQVPERTRVCYIPTPGYVFIESDYKAIEFRVMVSVAPCQPALRAIKAGRDTHRICASVLYGVPESAVTEEQRTASKTITFGLLYGMEHWGLASRLGISNGAAKDMMDRYFRLWKGVAEWIASSHNAALRRGGSRTAFGRHRTLADLGSHDPRIRKKALRNVVNDAIQGGAADIVKMRMKPTMLAVKEHGGRILLMVHDSLLFEVPEDKVDVCVEVIPEAMKWTHRNFADMEVECKTGKNWGGLKVYKSDSVESGPGDVPPLIPTRVEVAENLRQKILTCQICTARKEARQVIPFAGPVDAKVMIFGRNPGQDEDREGSVFLGQAGKLLDEWIILLGLVRKNIFISNLVKCHTHLDREPTSEEAYTCRDRWLVRELKLVKPDVVFLLGNQCIRAILGEETESVTRIAGEVFRQETLGKVISFVPFYHPGYILRRRELDAKAVQILVDIKETVLSKLE